MALFNLLVLVLLGLVGASPLHHTVEKRSDSNLSYTLNSQDPVWGKSAVHRDIHDASTIIIDNVPSNGASIGPVVNSITVTDTPPHPITAKAITSNVASNGAGIGPVINSPTGTDVPPHTIIAKAITSNVAGNGAGLEPIINSYYIPVLPEHTIVAKAITSNVAGNSAGIGPIVNSNYVVVFPEHTIIAKAVTTNVAANSAGLGPIVNSVYVSNFPPHPITFDIFRRNDDKGPEATLSRYTGPFPPFSAAVTPTFGVILGGHGPVSKRDGDRVGPLTGTPAVPIVTSRPTRFPTHPGLSVFTATSINPGGPIINVTETCTDPSTVPITKTQAIFPSLSPTAVIGLIQKNGVTSIQGGPGPVKPHTTNTPTSVHGSPGSVKPYSTSGSHTLEPGFFGPKARGDGHHEAWEHNPGLKIPLGPNARFGFVTSVIRAAV